MLLKLLGNQKIDPFYERTLMIDGVEIDMRLIPFLELNICPFLLRLVFYRISS